MELLQIDRLRRSSRWKAILDMPANSPARFPKLSGQPYPQATPQLRRHEDILGTRLTSRKNWPISVFAAAEAP